MPPDNHVMAAHCHLITTLWWHSATDTTVSSEVMLGKEGFLYKQGGKHKTWKYRYVVAVPGRLAYYKNKPHNPGVSSCCCCCCCCCLVATSLFSTVSFVCLLLVLLLLLFTTG